MQGEHLQRGNRLVDIDIRLGDAKCVPVSLTHNQIDCRPPTNKPNKHIGDRFCERDALSMKVSDYHLTRQCTRGPQLNLQFWGPIFKKNLKIILRFS